MLGAVDSQLFACVCPVTQARCLGHRLLLRLGKFPAYQNAIARHPRRIRCCASHQVATADFSHHPCTAKRVGVVTLGGKAAVVISCGCDIGDQHERGCTASPTG